MQKSGLIPFNLPCVTGEELPHVAQAVTNQKLSGDGAFNRKCREWLQSYLQTAFIALTPSCTAALEMAYLLIDLKVGDEVILPSFTFTSTATAITLFGATPVFVDVDESLNIDLARVERAITKKTRAVCAVHYAGQSCDMNALTTLLPTDIYVIEDAAQALMAKQANRPLGSYGHLAAFSFHETKNITCGEGGALAVNDKNLQDRAEILRDKGTNRQRFLRGEVDKYTWQDKGSSYLLGELSAGYLWGQLQNANAITDRRRQIWDRYSIAFEQAERSGILRRCHINDHNSHNAHIFYLILETSDQVENLRKMLITREIYPATHYVPLHDSPAGKRYGRVSGDLNKTNFLANRILRLPLFFNMTDHEVDRVIAAVLAFFGAQ